MKKVILLSLSLVMSSTSFAKSCHWVYQDKIRDLSREIDSKKDGMTPVWAVLGLGAVITTAGIIADVSLPAQSEYKYAAHAAEIMGGSALAFGGGHAIVGGSGVHQLEFQQEQYKKVTELLDELRLNRYHLMIPILADIKKVKVEEVDANDPALQTLAQSFISNFDSGNYCLAGFPMYFDSVKEQLKKDFDKEGVATAPAVFSGNRAPAVIKDGDDEPTNTTNTKASVRAQ